MVEKLVGEERGKFGWVCDHLVTSKTLTFAIFCTFQKFKSSTDWCESHQQKVSENLWFWYNNLMIQTLRTQKKNHTALFYFNLFHGFMVSHLLIEKPFTNPLSFTVKSLSSLTFW